MIRRIAARPLRPYAAVLRTPGALAFTAAGLVARLPMSMYGLAIVLAVSESGGTYTRAGLAAGVATMAHAVGSPLQARVADRHGQARLLVPLLTAFGLALGSLTAIVGEAAVGDAPFALLLATSAATGLTFPQIGALVRARWARLHSAPRLSTAFAWESVLDEVVYLVGPLLAVLLSTGVHPLGGLVAVLVFTLGGGFAFAAQRATEPAVRAHPSASARERLPVGALGWMVAAFALMGTIFGIIELSTVALAGHLGATAASGPALAILAAGSLLAGLGAGAFPWKASPQRRFTAGQALLGLAVLPLALVGNVPLLFAASFVAGFAIAPTLIAGFSMVESEVPQSRLTEGLAWASMAITVGAALGAAVSGPVIDRIGPSQSFLVASACGGVAAVAGALGGVAGARRARREQAAPDGHRHGNGDVT